MAEYQTAAQDFLPALVDTSAQQNQQAKDVANYLLEKHAMEWKQSPDNPENAMLQAHANYYNQLPEENAKSRMYVADQNRLARQDIAEGRNTDMAMRMIFEQGAPMDQGMAFLNPDMQKRVTDSLLTPRIQRWQQDQDAYNQAMAPINVLIQQYQQMGGNPQDIQGTSLSNAQPAPGTVGQGTGDSSQTGRLTPAPSTPDPSSPFGISLPGAAAGGTPGQALIGQQIPSGQAPAGPGGAGGQPAPSPAPGVGPGGVPQNPGNAAGLNPQLDGLRQQIQGMLEKAPPQPGPQPTWDDLRFKPYKQILGEDQLAERTRHDIEQEARWKDLDRIRENAQTQTATILEKKYGLLKIEADAKAALDAAKTKQLGFEDQTKRILAEAATTRAAAAGVQAQASKIHWETASANVRGRASDVSKDIALQQQSLFAQHKKISDTLQKLGTDGAEAEATLRTYGLNPAQPPTRQGLEQMALQPGAPLWLTTSLTGHSTELNKVLSAIGTINARQQILTVGRQGLTDIEGQIRTLNGLREQVGAGATTASGAPARPRPAPVQGPAGSLPTLPSGGAGIPPPRSAPSGQAAAAAARRARLESRL